MGLFSFLRREREKAPEPEAPAQAPAPADKPASSLSQRLGERLVATRQRLQQGLRGLFQRGQPFDEAARESLEDVLLSSDVGMPATQRIVEQTALLAKRDGLELEDAMRQAMQSLLQEVEQPLEMDLAQHKPYVILVVGVNGSGKTTTIGKLARKVQEAGHSVMLAAGDTFRAAAIEQLQAWGERNSVPVVAQHKGADAAAVIFDAYQSAQARGIDVLIADTAGRLQSNSGLMDELKKIKRVLGRQNAAVPHEVLLVLDGSTGQNGLQQARQFDAAVGVTGLAVTKLDGSARGGMLFSIAAELGIATRFIGVGETIDDLRVFQAEAFVEALLGKRAST